MIQDRTLSSQNHVPSLDTVGFACPNGFTHPWGLGPPAEHELPRLLMFGSLAGPQPRHT